MISSEVPRQGHLAIRIGDRIWRGKMEREKIDEGLGELLCLGRNRPRPVAVPVGSTVLGSDLFDESARESAPVCGVVANVGRRCREGLRHAQCMLALD